MRAHRGKKRGEDHQEGGRKTQMIRRAEGKRESLNTSIRFHLSSRGSAIGMGGRKKTETSLSGWSPKNQGTKREPLF